MLHAEKATIFQERKRDMRQIMTKITHFLLQTYKRELYQKKRLRAVKQMSLGAQADFQPSFFNRNISVTSWLLSLL